MADFMKDPKMQKLLEQLISRPETLSSMDVEPEGMEDAEAMAIQEPEAEEYEMPEDIEESAGQLEQSSDTMLKGMSEALPKQPQSPSKYEGDPAITDALRKLKAGQPLEEDAEVTPEDIDNPSMDSDLRKAALKKVKQKYLGM